MNQIMRAFRYRIYPKQAQIKKLEESFSAKRFVWNHFLEINMKRFELQEGILSYEVMSGMLTDLKRENKWLFSCEKSALQNTLKNLAKAYDRFFKGPMTYTKKKIERSKRTDKPLSFYDLECHPKFKSWKNYEQSIVMNLTNNNIEVKENERTYTSIGKYKKQNCRIKLPKIKLVKIAYSRPYQGVIQNATLTKEADGRYYISICCKDVPQRTMPTSKADVGIDLGITIFATMSDGKIKNNPKYYRKNESKLAKLQKALSRKEKWGKNYQKTRLQLNRQHKKISHSREDFLHKFTSDLVYSYDRICIEDLKPKEMKQNRLYAKSISDASYSKFRLFLTYKMNRENKQLIVIDQYYASSQICHTCGHQNKTLKDTTIRKWKCEVCNSFHDRDLNASKNILKEGLEQGRYKVIK